jgi:hypothetical protein
MPGIRRFVFALMIGLVSAACRTSQSSGVARVHSQSSTVLVAWLGGERLPKDLQDRDPTLDQMICDELIARREVGFLLSVFNTSKNEEVRNGLVGGVLYHIDDRRIYDAFVNRLDDQVTEESYYVAMYLAKQGNPAALATLNRHYFQYPVSSWQWSHTVELFGRYRFRPAASNLVVSLDAAFLNLSWAACNALHEIFPDSPSHFCGPAEAKEYYSQRLGDVSNDTPAPIAGTFWPADQ